MDDPRARTRRILRRIAISIASPILVLALLDFALVLFDFQYPPKTSPIVVEMPEGWSDDRSLHDRSVRTLWRPSPGARIPWTENERINAEGYRGPLLAREKTPGTVRIATLGDSSTFGHSVQWDECYTARLPALFASAGRRAEVIDAGVIGFSARQGLERWRELVRDYHPDYVVAAFGAVIDHVPAMGKNDDALIREKVLGANAAWLLLERLRRDLRVMHFLAWCADGLRGGRVELAHEKHEHQLLQNTHLDTVGALDWPGDRRVPLADFEQCLLTLRTEVEASGAKLVLMSMPRRPKVERDAPVLLEYTKKIVELGTREGIDVVDARAALGKAASEGHTIPELMVDQFHPSPLGHERIAAALFDVLQARLARDGK